MFSHPYILLNNVLTVPPYSEIRYTYTIGDEVNINEKEKKQIYILICYLV